MSVANAHTARHSEMFHGLPLHHAIAVVVDAILITTSPHPISPAQPSISSD